MNLNDQRMSSPRDTWSESDMRAIPPDIRARLAQLEEERHSLLSQIRSPTIAASVVETVDQSDGLVDGHAEHLTTVLPQFSFLADEPGEVDSIEVYNHNSLQPQQRPITPVSANESFNVNNYSFNPTDYSYRLSSVRRFIC